MQSLKFESAPRRATLEDVAREAGVSTMTVSRVLNGQRRNSPHQEAILRAVRFLDFEPNPVAQQLAQGGRSPVIGLFSSAPDLGVGSMIARRIQGTMAARGQHVALHSSGFQGAPGTDEIVDLNVLQALRRQRVSAIICSITTEQEAAREEIRRFKEEGGIVVAYGASEASVLPESDQVIFDVRDSVRKATEYLLAMGHRHIGFCHHGHDKPLDPRLTTTREVLKAHGLELPEFWVFAGDVYEANGARLAESFLKLQFRPTALIVVNDASAATFVHQLLRQGLSVPRDVSVVGQDDVPAAKYCVVPLTTVTQPVEEIAAGVCDFLCDRLEGRYQGPPRRKTIQGNLVERESVQRLQ